MRNIYDRDWHQVHASIAYPVSSRAVPKPPNIEKMIQIAECISKDLPDARIDLYNINHEKIYFGEITLYHGSGMEQFHPKEFGYELGSYMQLDRYVKAGHDKRTLKCRKT